eukprot:CAMPEP_0197606370 /NCGR_PEP_ID=MMETSP1326-20131121/44909_1 /TAXON_ID=1155430 /ORGANISM="Genus nov. species nov., Strain RCC2288" /LENGTH=748 /DNA_ID=CAMNT_0043174275 /DNA_START=271 /DNA_END=2514 /DNA_ORIENTATION=-
MTRRGSSVEGGARVAGAPAHLLLLALCAGASLFVSARAQVLGASLDDGASQTGDLKAGQTAVFSVRTKCEGFLHVESWDLKRLAGPVAAKADPMLMVRYGGDPSARYQPDNVWSWPEGTFKDIEGYKLLRPYHHVSIDLRTCAVRCAAQCAKSADPKCGQACGIQCVEPARSQPFNIAIYNVELWMTNTLNYQVMATCVPSYAAAPPCPRPMGEYAGDCSGRGACSAPNVIAGYSVSSLASATAAVDDSASYGSCSCNSGYGDVGCDKTLTKLVSGQTMSGTIPVGEWSYYQFEVKSEGGGAGPVTMLVELNRRGGDPVLFVKKVDETDGGIRGGVPSVSDYGKFADTEGFRSRVNYHYRLLENALPGRYYVAVFNNDVYIQEEATFTVSARVSAPSYQGRPAGPPLCAANCSAPQGVCMSPIAGITTGGGVATTGTSNVGNCECAAGFGGRMCEGTLRTVALGVPTSGDLAPGGWAYIRFTADAAVAEKGLSVTFKKDGGHPVLILRRGGFPTLLDNSYVFSTTEHLDRESTFKISPRDLTAGEFIIGVFNMNYYVNSPCRYELVINHVEETYMMVTPSFMSIILVVIMSMFLCLLLSVCKRLLQRGAGSGRRSIREILLGRPAVSFERDREGVAMGHIHGGHGAQGAHAAPRGCPVEIIDAIPTSIFNKEQWETGKWAKEDASCSVCIEGFEDGDRLRMLPACAHVFHRECIDEWLAQHTTCPNCRASLVPVAEAAAGGAGGGGGG